MNYLFFVAFNLGKDNKPNSKITPDDSFAPMSQYEVTCQEGLEELIEKVYGEDLTPAEKNSARLAILDNNR